jgi:hypothetical protein
MNKPPSNKYFGVKDTMHILPDSGLIKTGKLRKERCLKAFY